MTSKTNFEDKDAVITNVVSRLCITEHLDNYVEDKTEPNIGLDGAEYE